MASYPVAIHLGRGHVRHAAAWVDGHLTPITACGRTIGRDRNIVTGAVVVSCIRCLQALNKEG